MNAVSSVTGLTGQAETQHVQTQQSDQQAKVQQGATQNSSPQDKVTISSQAQQALAAKADPYAGEK